MTRGASLTRVAENIPVEPDLVSTSEGTSSVASCPPINARALGDSLIELRARPPLVQCLTNMVVAHWTANVLLAVGAVPAMVDNPRESADFSQIASSVLINLGTPYDDTVDAMRASVKAADTVGTPWVLDPVAVGGLGWRTDLALEFLRFSPTIIRGNASEILALSGGLGGNGVDSVDSPEAALGAAKEIARTYRTVVAVSGPIDHLTNGEQTVLIANGHEWMTQVTGVGCALGAVMAAFARVTSDPLQAAAGATAVLTVAAEHAAATTLGPGSFAVRLIDCLSAMTPERLVAAVHLL